MIIWSYKIRDNYFIKKKRKKCLTSDYGSNTAVIVSKQIIKGPEHIRDIYPKQLRTEHDTLHIFGLSFERPILGDNPKAHAENRMKTAAFHMKSGSFHLGTL